MCGFYMFSAQQSYKHFSLDTYVMQIKIEHLTEYRISLILYKKTSPDFSKNFSQN